MKSRLARFGVLAMAFAFVTTLAVAGAVDNPDIETIMKKVNGKTGLHKAIATDLKAANIDWDAEQKKSKEYYELISSLGKNDPPKGDKKSWEKLTKSYADNAKSLNDACEKKDKSGVNSALNKIQGSCMACHKAHRG
jgi:cytochrome c556